jgi:4-aminobutyrate aminotransferase-like enzyme/Ser/Thr protein kinase RdoA (MazF antagonist)
MTTDQAQDAASRYWNINGTATALSSEWGGTFLITTEHRAGKNFLLKIAPTHLREGRIRLEVAVVKHLSSLLKELWCPELISSIHGEDIAHTEFGDARMYSWIEGKLWADVRPHDRHLLASLGQSLGFLTKALVGFDHPEAHAEFEWALKSTVWKDTMSLLPDDLKDVCDHYVNRYENILKHQLGSLRHGVNYHDANDYNILVSPDVLTPTVIAFIDYGDCHYGPIVNDLAICLAYALMDQSDILGAARIIISGYHRVSPLLPEELEVLQDLICMRLVISLVHAARRKAKDPGNVYWQVSTSAAEKLLQTLRGIHPHLMLCTFRAACGLEPSPRHDFLCDWLKKHKPRFHPVMGFELSKEPVTVFDWSTGSVELGGLNAIQDLEEQTYRTFRRMDSEGTRVGIGRYDEPRPIYTTHEYEVSGLDTPAMRTIHLGIDLIMPAGTPVYAPIDGRVVTLTNNAGDKEYGPLVILEHKAGDGFLFYTLYGHNNIYTLSLLQKGQEVKAGEKMGEIGDFPENGNWVPHLHFQIITDLLGCIDDYPGVADPDAKDIWLSLCLDPNLILGIRHADLKYHYADTAGLLRKRKKVLGSNLSLSYHEPLHIVRGWKTHLYDEDGRTYLDTVNNIAHIGHEHPRIVQAGQKQMAVLNTNTRYLHRNLLTLSQKLLETLPAHLEVVWFVNSGSEANELALRIARAYTGRYDTLVLEEGYHGNTQACFEVSHYKFKHLKKLETTNVVPIGVYGKVANFAKDADDSTVNRSPLTVTPSMVFIHESLPSCAGQIVPHEDFFMDIYAEIKKHGGICIADEVQTGLGRVGSHYWAFELFTIAPDIVTIGKPLGNGHPIAAVACTRELANAFAKGPEFFSSFGGNPVSCAIATEVLSVIEDEDLQANAKNLGEYWMSALRELQSVHSVIGDVRGHGLFIGIEFLKPETCAAAKQKAEYVVRRMLDHRILTSLEGPNGNVMKIKPPMSITKEEVDQFLGVLEKILKEDLVKTNC